jgi:hypothetical protein
MNRSPLFVWMVLSVGSGLVGGGLTEAMAQARVLEGTRSEGELQPFLGEPAMAIDVLFSDERFPNVVTAQDGTIVATWGSQRVRARRTEDGGASWGPEIFIGEGIHGGGVIVDEQSGDLLVFTHPEHPPRDGEAAPRTLYRSRDQGKTWSEGEASFRTDVNDYLPSLHMMEHGTTLVHGQHAGRLIRPARVYRRSPERYCSAIFSDDGGTTWIAGEPFPVKGTGEAAMVELSDGRLLATARKSYFAEDEPLRHERLFAFSDDGGRSWHDARFSAVVPDGPRYRGTDRRGANYNGHFGLFGGLCRLPVEGRDVLITSNADHDGHERVRLAVWARSCGLRGLISPSRSREGRALSPGEGLRGPSPSLRARLSQGERVVNACKSAT